MLPPLLFKIILYKRIRPGLTAPGLTQQKLYSESSHGMRFTLCCVNSNRQKKSLSRYSRDLNNLYEVLHIDSVIGEKSAKTQGFLDACIHTNCTNGT